MDRSRLFQNIKDGQRVYGTLITSTSPHLARQLPHTGLDFVFIDTEHIPINDQELSWMCVAYQAMNLTPIVRIPEPDPFRASKVLDGGAGGIIAPYVESVDQIQALRGAIKLGPLKGKKLEQMLHSKTEANGKLNQYLRKRNQEKLMIVNIESVPAIENLDQLLAVPDLDAVLIGPHDLSVSMEIPEEYDHPDFDKAVRTIIEKARTKGVGAGIHFWGDLPREIEWARAGANIFLHSADVLLFTTALRDDLRQARAELGDSVAADDYSPDAI